MGLKVIRLELARDTDHPEGDPRHGYELAAPLDAQDHIDPAEWKQMRQFCTVRRFTPDGDDEFGRLIRGSDRQWRFHYDIATEPAEDEPGFRFASHAFRPGEYVSITEHDGVTRTFKVVSVR
jgi:hypothetical protein